MIAQAWRGLLQHLYSNRAIALRTFTASNTNREQRKRRKRMQKSNLKILTLIIGFEPQMRQKRYQQFNDVPIRLTSRN